MENLPIPIDATTTWLLVLYIIVRDALIPLANKMIPARAEQRAALESRETEALEKISIAYIQTSERLSSLDSGQSIIIKSLESQSQALAVLVDRVGRSADKPARTRKGD